MNQDFEMQAACQGPITIRGTSRWTADPASAQRSCTLLISQALIHQVHAAGNRALNRIRLPVYGAAMARPLRPPGIPSPLARYSHGLEVAAGKRLVTVSGQLGIRSDGTVPADATEQARLCFANIAAILAEAGMTIADVIRLNAYVTAPEHMRAYMDARDEAVGDPPPASTLVIISGLARPEFKVEIEAIAAAD